MPYHVRIPPLQSLRVLAWRVAKITAIAVVSAIVLLTAAALTIVNTPSLRRAVVEMATARLNESLREGGARVSFDDFRGSLLFDIAFSNVRLVADQTDTIAFIPELSLQYDLATLFLRRVSLSEIRLFQPRIQLARRMDGEWNLARILSALRDNAPDDAPPPNWTIAVREFAIESGSLTTLDSLQDAAEIRRLANQRRINAGRLRVSDIYLSLSAQSRLRASEHAVSVRRCSFREEASDFRLRRAAFFAFADTTRVEINNFTVATPRSAFKARVAAEGANIFQLPADIARGEISAGKALEQVTFRASLVADSLAFSDAQRFFVGADAFADALAVRFEAEGSASAAIVRRCEIGKVEPLGRTSTTFLSFEGKTIDFLNPQKTQYSVRFHPTRLPSEADIRRYAPRLGLPSIGALGAVALERATAKGNAQSVSLEARARSSLAGAAEIVLALDWRDTLRYEAALNTENLNLAALPALQAPESRLNARITMNGQGVTLAELKARTTIEASASEVAGRRFDALSLEAEANDGGVFTLKSLKVHWNRAAEFLLEDYAGGRNADEVHGAGALAASDLWASGWLNLQNPDLPRYKLDVRASRLDFSRLLQMPDAASDASFTLNVLGSGFSADSLRGTLNFVAYDFHTPKKAFDPFAIRARLDFFPKPNNPFYREFRLRSELANADVKGVFTMQDFIASFANTVDNSIFAVRRKYHHIRDSLNASTYEGLYIRRPERLRALDAEFHLQPRDISISRLFSGFAKVQCAGSLRGSVQGTTHDYVFRLEPSRIEEFFYTDGFTQVHFSDVRLQGEFHNLAQGDSLNVVAARARLESDSVFRFNDFVFRRSIAEGDFRNDIFDFAVKSVWDDSVLAFYAKARLDMSAGVLPLSVPLRIDTAWALYRGDMEWSSVGEIAAELGKEGLLIERLALKRPKAETVYLGGQIWFDHYSNAQLTVESMPLQDINRLFPPNDRIPTLEPLRGMLERLECRLSGSPERPQIGVLANASNVYYDGAFLGRCALSATHQDSVVRGSLDVQNPLLVNDTLYTLKIRARHLPFNLAFTDVAERLVPGKPIDITFDAEQFPLAALNLFTPGVVNLQGYGDAHFSIAGTTPQDIAYSGNAVIPVASFVFEATNLKYFAEAKASIVNNTVTIESFSLANDPLDYPRGRAFANGTVTVNGFSIAGFDITARVPQQGLFVLGNASRIPNPQLFGDVVIATGVKPLRFYGTLEEPFLRGDVNILEAKVNFPEIRTVKAENKLFCFETITRERGGLTTTARDCNPQEYALLVPTRDSADGGEGQNFERLTVAELAERTAERAVALQQENAHPIDSNVGALRVVSAEALRAVSSPNNASEFDDKSGNGLLSAAKTEAEKAELRARLGFAQKIDYDVNVALLGNFSVTMDWGPFEQLVANLAQENPEQPLRYVKTPDRPNEHRLFGDLILREGSTYKFYRIFNASGKLSFNTGVMSNPRLQLNAVLRGQRTVSEQSGVSEYIVNLSISGTKQSPRLAMNYVIDNVPGVGDSVKIQNDAIMLLLVGRTQEEFSLGGALGGVTRNYSSSLASRLLTDLLQGTGVVRSADISFGGGRDGSQFNLSQARVQFTGEISNLGVLWQVANDFGTNTPNTSFSIDIPFRTFLDQELFRNIVLQITRTSALSNSSVFLRQQREWEVKIGSRNTW